MKSLFFALLFLYVLTYAEYVNAQPIGNTLRQKPWNAQWIAVPGDNGHSYGVFYFRKNINLKVKPSSFVVHVSADNRYKLYVNGILVSLGPARGDTYYWNYETVDLASYLSAGTNIISAKVWNEAEYRPEAQISVRTGFILQGNTAPEEIINTNNTWRCIRDNGYQPISTFGVAASGELVDMNHSVKNWLSGTQADSTWVTATTLDGGHLKGLSDGFGWMLVPSAIPQMELTYQRIPVVRKATGITLPAGFPGKKSVFSIPANTTATLLLDQTYETNAYLTLNFSNGHNATISIIYAEAPFDNLKKSGRRKSNRNEVDGKDFWGRKDSLLSDGSTGQSFTTLYWRTYRYIQLTVRTKNEPLVIDDIYGTFTGYPFKQNASLNTDNAELKDIFNIGWRTARLNAIETYTDCPYYEQLQYIGDTRIQAMISYYNSGDDRLARNALTLMDHSRIAEGVTQSRYPTHDTQIIPPFSLLYIGMLHDYWTYRPDSNFIRQKLPGERAILNFFSNYQQPDGSLKDTPYWTFVDWAGGKGWNFGSAPKGGDGCSAVLDLQLLWAYQWAADMEGKIGMSAYTEIYSKKATQLKQTIQEKYWDQVKMLYADTKDKNSFSQHANALAVLTGVADTAILPALCKRMLTDTSLTQCSIYFKYYLHQALVKGGMGDHYLEWLGDWRKNIQMGLTTWAEEPDLYNTRSDCHAWGASPNIEFFRTVLGIDSDSPGFARVKIQPHLGDLKTIGGEMPHPNGKIAVNYTRKGTKWHINISLPHKTAGKLIWKGQTYTLKEGVNALVI
jgi:alpha-L-rhamnosidase